jgi:hypothetical protein
MRWTLLSQSRNISHCQGGLVSMTARGSASWDITFAHSFQLVPRNEWLAHCVLAHDLRVIFTARHLKAKSTQGVTTAYDDVSSLPCPMENGYAIFAALSTVQIVECQEELSGYVSDYGWLDNRYYGACWIPPIATKNYLAC